MPPASVKVGIDARFCARIQKKRKPANNPPTIEKPMPIRMMKTVDKNRSEVSMTNARSAEIKKGFLPSH